MKNRAAAAIFTAAASGLMLTGCGGGDSVAEQGADVNTGSQTDSVFDTTTRRTTESTRETSRRTETTSRKTTDSAATTTSETDDLVDKAESALDSAEDILSDVWEEATSEVHPLD